MSKFCKDCKWGVAITHRENMTLGGTDEFDAIECRRYPPQVYTSESRYINVAQVFPQLYPSDWCGEWTDGRTP